MGGLVVQIPYKARYPEVHNALESHRFCVLVAHRRFGKTVLVVNHMIKEAVKCSRPDGSFAYIAPFRNQAKDVAWTYLKRYTAPIPGRVINESELSVCIPTAKNGARIRIFGADNPDALRGLYFDGVVMDEVAQMKPDMWEEVLRPALSDRRGWAVFIGTPKGPNLFKDIYDTAVREQGKGNPDWKAMLYTVEQTTCIDPRELEGLRLEMSEGKFAQEYLCDFTASSDDALIPMEFVNEAMGRKAVDQAEDMPLIMGVDVAAMGNDSSVVTFRRGLVMEPQHIFHGLELMELCGQIARLYDEKRPDALFVDGIGVGAGVVSRLRELGIPATDAQAGARALNPAKAVNRRAEMWLKMREWIKDAAIPRDDILLADLAALIYSYNSAGALVLEPKDDAKKRLKRSPDRADSLALTFYAPVYRNVGNEKRVADMDYDPIGEWGRSVAWA